MQPCGSLAEQRVVRGSISTIVQIARDEEIAPPALLIIGEVATLAKGGNTAVSRAPQDDVQEPDELLAIAQAAEQRAAAESRASV